MVMAWAKNRDHKSLDSPSKIGDHKPRGDITLATVWISIQFMHSSPPETKHKSQ